MKQKYISKYLLIPCGAIAIFSMTISIGIQSISVMIFAMVCLFISVFGHLFMALYNLGK